MEVLNGLQPSLQLNSYIEQDFNKIAAIWHRKFDSQIHEKYYTQNLPDHYNHPIITTLNNPKSHGYVYYAALTSAPGDTIIMFTHYPLHPT